MPQIAYRLAESECWRADVVDHGQDIILSDGEREERYDKSMAVRLVTTQGEIMWLLHVEFPALTKAHELATLEERIAFESLNGSTQVSLEKQWGPYVSLATLVLVVVMAIWLWGTSNSASSASASVAAMGVQMQHVTTQVDLLAKGLK